MAFISWSDELSKFKEAFASRGAEAMMKSGWTDGRGQSVTFRRLDDVQNHLSWLEARADQEANASVRGRNIFQAGYGGR